jgi:antibiotic biosynthesis monooxygenase (ABM) superfamily enzyme
MTPSARIKPTRWLPRVVMTLAAWVVAFLIATAMLAVFGDELGSLPLPLRALVISGVLVVVMANLVMPVLAAAIARWITLRYEPREPGGAG